MNKIDIIPNDIYNIDCLDGMRKLPDNSIDCIITDPPYGVEFSKGFDDSKEHILNCISSWLSEMYRLLKPNCHCYIFIPTKEVTLWLCEIEKVFQINNILATRTYTSSNYVKNNFQFNTQLVVYCSKGTAKAFNKVDFFKTSEAWFNDKRNKNPKEYTYSYPAFIQNVFGNTKANAQTKDRHPCEKNPELIEFLIKISTNENELVLEPFVGGASTIIACINAKRQFIGFELSEEYYHMATKRIKRCSGGDPNDN